MGVENGEKVDTKVNLDKKVASSADTQTDFEEHPAGYMGKSIASGLKKEDQTLIIPKAEPQQVTKDDFSDEQPRLPVRLHLNIKKADILRALGKSNEDQ